MKNMRSSYKTERIDFSSGPIFKNIVFFAFPLIFTNLLQVLYSVSDTVIVSMSDEPDAVGAIGTTAAMINLIVNLFIGCSVGAKVAAAKKLGAEDSVGASTVAHTAMTVGIIFGAACGLIGFFTSEPLIEAMGNSGRLLELAVLYSKIYFLGVPFISVTNFACALIHADGDTKTPLRVLSLAGMLNVILNVISVKFFKRSVDGMAIATVISNAVSAILLTLKLAGSEYRFDLRRCGIDKEAFLNILHIGLPAAVQSALFSLSHMVIQSSIVTLNNAAAGADAAFQPIVKGSAAVASIESFGFTTVNATAQAAISFVARNDGAKNYRRIRLGMLYCYISVFLLAAVFAALMLIFREPEAGAL